MNREHLHIWTYKDSSRYWWRLEVWKSGEVIAHWDPSVIDWEWAYQMYRDGEEFYHGSITGQYDEVPDPEEFFLDLQNYVNHLIPDVAKYATLELKE
jgi:hypothetical protein